MCGICGVIGIDRTEQAEAIRRRMMEAIRHRGPDDDGLLVERSRRPKTCLCIGVCFIAVKLIDIRRIAPVSRIGNLGSSLMKHPMADPTECD